MDVHVYVCVHECYAGEGWMVVGQAQLKGYDMSDHLTRQGSRVGVRKD